ncbi:hypothetical protein GCM10023115_22750 [Pontixanthobacter gangjinensis]|uniref:DUF2147 domain-containing protein n=1 Tax=Pontixanthobacter gangjinensis TaxID=1028742 RepID=A0A6I4SQ81_9SPHN|nr:DUF2147 domain-containing protein [Pontixanthobacter gangjinensis]MXO57518.1 DUF2147 domain-containing protein [Pontixanthobacter gangjinensis]
MIAARYLLPASAALVFATPAFAAPEAITGNWKTDDGKAVIQFYKCGGDMCGKISRFLVPEPAGGARDDNNPDKAKRSRALKGLPIFWSLSENGSKYKGKGYSPEEGRYFNAQVWRAGNTLKVQGCVAVFCKTVTFTKV